MSNLPRACKYTSRHASIWNTNRGSTCRNYDGKPEGDVNGLVLPIHLVTVDHNDNPDSAYKACPPIQGRTS
jgi:hypothetical protein